MDGIIDAASLQINRRQNLVAASVIRMLRKMCLDLGDRGSHIHAGGRSFEASRKRCVGQLRMADRRIKGNRNRRHKNQNSQRGKPGSPWRCRLALIRPGLPPPPSDGAPLQLWPLAHLPAPPDFGLRPAQFRRVGPCKVRRRFRRAQPRAAVLASGQRTLMTAAAVRMAKINHNMEP